jgi:general secretion pathway protein G
MKEFSERTERERGFTLVEVIVIVAILAILAGILVPMIFSQIDEARIARAESDIKSISSALLTMRKDTGVWPNLYGASCTPTTTLLYGLGTEPAGIAAAAYNMTIKVRFKDVLMRDDEECYNAYKYKGPYLPMVGADPWGNYYFLAASSFVNTSPVILLSAGPNGQVDTPAFSLAPIGDDIGLRIK